MFFLFFIETQKDNEGDTILSDVEIIQDKARFYIVEAAQVLL